MRGLADNRGFTLIELLIVIAIIAILASIAIPQYMKYQRKAKVSSYAMPIARACLMDLATYCVENPTVTNLSVDTTYGKNCVTPQQTPGGEVTLNGEKITCDSTGALADGTVKGTLSPVGNEYTAVCTVDSQSKGGFKCTVQ